MRVYRIEAQDGRGPYNAQLHGHPARAHDVKDRMCYAHCNPVTHPNGPNDLGTWNFESYHLFACGSMQQLYRWFGGYLPQLLATGFKLCVYEVDPAACIYGKYQLVYDSRTAIKIK